MVDRTNKRSKAVYCIPAEADHPTKPFGWFCQLIVGDTEHTYGPFKSRKLARFELKTMKRAVELTRLKHDLREQPLPSPDDNSSV